MAEVRGGKKPGETAGLAGRAALLGQGLPLAGRVAILCPMSLAPLFVPVMLQRKASSKASGKASVKAPAVRWFRLGIGVDLSGEMIRLRSAVPDELRKVPLRVSFHLPPPTDSAAKLLGVAWNGEIDATAVSAEVKVDVGTERERAESLLLVFTSLTPLQRQRLCDYATLRLQGD